MGTVAGLFDTWIEAQQGVAELQRVGFCPEDFSVVARDRPATLEEKTATKTGEASVVGAVGGGVVGGLAGLVVGLGALTIPGIGPALAAGPLSAALAGSALGAATGGLVGALGDLGMSADQVRDFQEAVERGSILLTVNTPAVREVEARVILRQHGMHDLSEVRLRWDADPVDVGREAPTGLVAPVPSALEQGLELEDPPAPAVIEADHEGIILAGGASGAVVGGIIGALVGGPVGSALGVAVGAAAGGAAGTALEDGEAQHPPHDSGGEPGRRD